MNPGLYEDVSGLRGELELQSGLLHRRAQYYRDMGDAVAAEYCMRMRGQIWRLVDDIAADAKADGVL